MTDAAGWLANTLARRAGYNGALNLPPPTPGDAASRWRASGLSELTGPVDGDPILPARDYASRLAALVDTTQVFAAALGGGAPSLSMTLFTERALDLGLGRRGAISAGGAARMMRCADDWAVVNLARPEDLDLFDAWIGGPAGDDHWTTLSTAARCLEVEAFVGTGRLLGVPVARVGSANDEQQAGRPDQAHGAPGIHRWARIAKPRALSELLVVDLSGLWAGPLCGRLFAELGARVVKVESTHRPDGAREGSPAFFERMNGGKESARFDFKTEDGRQALCALIQQADVVIEAARPRAMAQLGVDPAEIARARPHMVWIGLTAYGRTGPWSNAVGFGDDCAAAAGLVVRDAAGAPMFVGDALADPIAGLMAAAAGLAVLAAGGGALVDVSLREAAAFVAQAAPDRDDGMSGDLLIRNAEIDGVPGLDLRVRGGVVAEIGQDLRGPEPMLNAAGGALIPGLIDHHIHLFALAAQRASLRLGPEEIAGPPAFRAALRAADRAAPAGAWLRGVAYHESVAGPLDRVVLDTIVRARPLRIQHRSGGLWVLNSAALDTVGAMESVADCIERDAAGAPTGRFWRGDAWLRERLPSTPPPLGPVMRALATMGVTGVADASASNDTAQARLFETARVAGDLPQRLMLMGAGALPASDAYRIGPVKILLDDDGLGDLETMAATIAFARHERRAVAVHCVSALQLAFTLAAFEMTGARAGDRIEHGGMIDAAATGEIARLGLTVVTQPGFIAERGDQYRAELEPEEIASLYPCASLLRARVPVAASSDAPYTSPDPWTAMAAAMRRTTPSGALLGAAERVDGETALGLYLGGFDSPGGPPRRIAVDQAADLCLLRTPRARALAAPSAEAVRATVIDGVVVYGLD